MSAVDLLPRCSLPTGHRCGHGSRACRFERLTLPEKTGLAAVPGVLIYKDFFRLIRVTLANNILKNHSHKNKRAGIAGVIRSRYRRVRSSGASPPARRAARLSIPRFHVGGRVSTGGSRSKSRSRSRNAAGPIRFDGSRPIPFPAGYFPRNPAARRNPASRLTATPGRARVIHRFC